MPTAHAALLLRDDRGMFALTPAAPAAEGRVGLLR